MKVLHITPGISPRIGGTSFVALGLCKGLAAQGMDVTLYTTDRYLDEPVCLDKPFKQDGFEIHFFKNFKNRKIQEYVYVPELARKLADSISGYDIVHIHGIWLYTDRIGSYYARKHNVPYIIRPRGSLEPHGLSKNSLIKGAYNYVIQNRIMNNAAAIHCMSAGESNNTASLGFKAPTITIHSGVEPPDEFTLAKDKGKARQKYPETVGKTVILFLARISPIKGMDRLCRAYGEIAKAYPNVHLVIAGQDNEGYKKHVLQMLKKYNALNRVTFTGFVSGDDKLSTFIDADIYCLPSYQEAHAVSVKEAMACRLPVVITNTMNFPEVAEKGAGFVCNGSPVELQNALVKLIENPSLRKEMGRNSRRLILEDYTWDYVAKKMVNHYEDILAQRNRN